MASRIELEPAFKETQLLQSETIKSAVANAYENHHSNKRNQLENLWIPDVAVEFVPSDEPLRLEDAVLSAIYVNGLTEDNLPYYTETIFGMFGQNEALKEWAKRWTAEEERHGDAIKLHQRKHKLFDKGWISRMRFLQLEGGEVPQPPNAVEGAIYVTIQEEATRVPHSRVSSRLKRAGDSEGSKAYGLIAGDEGGHHRFYKTVAMAMRDVDPDYFVVSFYNQARNFAMPGTGITGFKEHAEIIAAAGIFDVGDIKTIVSDLVKEFDIETLNLTNDEAKKARQQLMRLIKTFDFAERRHQETREKYETGHYEAPLSWREGQPVIVNGQDSQY